MKKLNSTISYNALEGVAELVYLTNPKTYDLVYINEQGAKTLGIDKTNLSNMKCHKALQGFDEPCPNCPLAEIKSESYLNWETLLNGKHFLIRSTMIKGEDGLPLNLCIGIDDTERVNARLKQDALHLSSDIIVKCTRAIFENTIISETLKRVADIIGKSLSVSRVYIVMESVRNIAKVTEWCNTGVKSCYDEITTLYKTYIKRHLPTRDRYSFEVITDIHQYKYRNEIDYGLLQNMQATTLVCAPLYDGNRFLGQFVVQDLPADKIETFVPMLETINYFLISEMRRNVHEHQLRQLIYYDALTDLHNRHSFTRRIESITAKHNKEVGIVFVDVNGLKSVNDLYGHEAGDRLIVDTAKKLCAFFAKKDIFRVGGDEFVIVQQGVTRSEFEANVAELNNALSVVDNASGRKQASVGYSWELNATNINKLINSADERMYADKQKSYRDSFIESKRYRQMNDEYMQYLDDAYLKNLIDNRILVPYIQPQVRLDTGMLVGGEALIRSTENNTSDFFPDQFISILERTDKIRVIDFYMLEQVCKYLQDRHDKKARRMPISVNLSRYTISHHTFWQEFTAVVDRYSFDKSLLHLEITESGESDITPKQLRIIDALHAYGFTVCMDDFGIKYANLLVFSQCNFSILKLDKTFVAGICNSERPGILIESIQSVCDKLEINLVIEGIETRQAVDVLLKLGCKFGQGFYYGKALPEDEFSALVDRNKPLPVIIDGKEH